ncbi:hypothetical protein [Phenylobacterium soli]|uniref:hypothetical protein n=1 Tax=Phenylobacterium soli TaxID=2170551 RepID=UPI001057C4E8|nr:hypothetical protein [Phenylobacterium soli]
MGEQRKNRSSSGDESAAREAARPDGLHSAGFARGQFVEHRELRVVGVVIGEPVAFQLIEWSDGSTAFARVANLQIAEDSRVRRAKPELSTPSGMNPK